MVTLDEWQVTLLVGSGVSDEISRQLSAGFELELLRVVPEIEERLRALLPGVAIEIATEH
ncbi:MAG: hypothetical protein AB7H43_15070 [Acidimicrobiia bacterium]